MENPYEHDWLDDEVHVGGRGLLVSLGAFVLFLLAPALSLLLPSLRPELSAKPPAGTLKARLAAWEEGARTLPLLESWRRSDQARLVRALGAGNRRVVATKDGWLHYRPDLESVFGRGPYYVEPPSVARERQDRAWQAPLPVVRDFAEQLDRRGIRLVFVPVPTKPMLCRTGLGLGEDAVPHPDWHRVAAELTDAGIEFVDLLPTIGGTGGDAARYLKQDTHWTPTAMAAAARAVAARIDPGAEARSPAFEELRRSSRGDLVGMLDLAESDAAALFPTETAALLRPAEPGTPDGDGEADVVLLGDSFVNIFEDPGLGFGIDGEESIGAGFAAHLAAALERPVRTIAVNGGGASSVREAFAALPPERLGSIGTVVWTFSARDLFLAELPARRAGIEWRRVELPDPAAGPPKKGSEASLAIEVVATLRERSEIENPNRPAYTEAVFSTLFESDDGGEFYVFHWAFRQRKLEPASALAVGRRYRLRLVPLESAAPAVQRATRLDDLFRTDLDPWFAELAEEAPDR